MDFQSTNIEFVQEFLKLQSEEAISRLEKLLRMEKNGTGRIGAYDRHGAQRENRQIHGGFEKWEIDRHINTG